MDSIAQLYGFAIFILISFKNNKGKTFFIKIELVHN